MRRIYKTPLLAIIFSSLIGCAAFNDNRGVSQEFISSLPTESYNSLSFDRLVFSYAEYCESLFTATPENLTSGFGLNVLRYTGESGMFNNLKPDNPFFKENPHYIRYRNALSLYPDVALTEMQAALNNHKNRLERFADDPDYFIHRVRYQLHVDRESSSLILIINNVLRFEEGVDTLRNEFQNESFRNQYQNNAGTRDLYQSRNNRQNNLYNNVFTHGTNNRATIDSNLPRLDNKITSDSGLISIESLSNSRTKFEFKLSSELAQEIVEKQISKNHIPVATLDLLIEPNNCIRSFRGGDSYALSGDIVGMMIKSSDLENGESSFIWFSEKLIPEVESEFR